MRDFLDGLDERLAAIAVDPPEPAPAAVTRKARRLRRAIVGALTAGVGTVIAIFAMTGTSLADLPILSTGTTDATAIRRQVPAVQRAGVDFSKAHAFGTPGGPGYVLATPKQDTVCIVIPDPRAPGDYGSSCGTPLAAVEADGLAAELVGDRGIDPNATSIFAFVLPDDADDVRLRSGGRTRDAEVEAGVAVGEITEQTDVLWTVDGKSASKRFEGPFQGTGGGLATCPDGRTVPLPDVGAERPATPGVPPDSSRFRDAVKRACR